LGARFTGDQLKHLQRKGKRGEKASLQLETGASPLEKKKRQTAWEIGLERDRKPRRNSRNVQTISRLRNAETETRSSSLYVSLPVAKTVEGRGEDVGLLGRTFRCTEGSSRRAAQMRIKTGDSQFATKQRKRVWAEGLELYRKGWTFQLF